MILLKRKKRNFEIHTFSLLDFLETYHSKIPSLTLSNKPRPSESMGNKCLRSGSWPRLLLTQSEKASCSSIRIYPEGKNKYYLRNRLSGYIIANSQQMFGLFHLAVHTEWVVPSDEASEVPPIVSKFSLLFTIFLKVVATSCDLSRAHNWF